jgi:glycosyltransferase involved in cell wall biosynthesis
MLDFKYKVTVVTVVFNDVVGIKKTMSSIFEQSLSNFEYVVVDGGSSDGTYEEILKQKGKIDQIIHECDLGLYDAMNKGIGIAKGEYIIFMNSSDFFCSPNSLESAAKLFYENTELAYYGDHILVSELGRNKYIRTPDTLDMLWKKMPICHQALFVKLDWHRNNLFNIYNIAADYEIVCKLYSERAIKKVHLPIANYLEGGVSEKSILKSTWERFKLARSFKLKAPFYLFSYYLILITYLFCKFSVINIWKRK